MRTAGQTLARSVPPVLTAALLVMWLILNDSLSLGHIVLGSFLGVALAWSSGALRPLKPRLRRPHLALELVGLVVLDVVRSNAGVAQIVLGLREARPGFVKIPLALEDPHGLAALACIVTATPGTVWVDHDTATSTLTLHVLDLRSEQQWIDWVKNRYERLLIEVFQ
ncbi:MAG TPA: Na+/H+ antiporter subunit E [Gammaproteobacteria bacterium]